MATREELHTLIDSMPEEAIDAARRLLSHFQVWPPALPSQVEELRQSYEQRLKEVQASGTDLGGLGVGGGMVEWPEDPPKGGLRTGYWSFDHSDGETVMVETHRYKDGYELAIIERIRIEGEHLFYTHEITGPGHKHDERDVMFDLT